MLYLSVSQCRNSYGESLETAACVSGCGGREGSQRLVVLSLSFGGGSAVGGGGGGTVMYRD